MTATLTEDRPVAVFDHLPPSGERLLTEKEAAAMLGLQPSTLRRWRSVGQPGQPEFCKVAGRSIRYRLSDLTAYMGQLETGGGAR